MSYGIGDIPDSASWKHLSSDWLTMNSGTHLNSRRCLILQHPVGQINGPTLES